MAASQIVPLVLCGFFLLAALWLVLHAWRSQEPAVPVTEDKAPQRSNPIDALGVPPTVMERTRELLRAKGVVLDVQLENYMVQGFKDYLIAVQYSRSGGLHAWPETVAMTSDTVDMLWHAWLEDDRYEETFTQLLGFPLIHLPEAPEEVAAQRGPGNIDFLKTHPPRSTIATYRALKAALPAAGRKVRYSGLYLLDSLAKNPDGFYYTGPILGAFERATADMDFVRLRGGLGSGACGTSCFAGGDDGIGGHGDHGAAHGCGGGHGCGSSCGSGGGGH